jgi:hypothetical protein
MVRVLLSRPNVTIIQIRPVFGIWKGIKGFSMSKRFAIVLLGFLTCLWSQTTSTTILGTVEDTSGSVIGGAKVTLTNIRTGVKADTLSTSTGDYTFPLIDIGEYTVSVEMNGFKSASRTGVIVQINEKVRADFKLEVGQVNERIQVTAEIAQLKTDEASLGNTVEQKRLVELPVNGRNVGNLAVLQPGVMFGQRGGLDGMSGGGGGIPIPGQTIAIVANGQRDTSQHATLDGVVATEARVNTVPFSPSPEAMEEVRVLTGSYSAEYGFNSGAQLVMVMRSGTNDLHGSAYDFLRNEKLDAEAYFQNYFNSATAARLPKPALRQNQFGGVIGGPVWIPKIYNGRNKTFFMFNYEGRRTSNPGLSDTALVPSVRMRTGDFGELLNIPTPVVITDPLTGTPFPNNIIPANRISATAKTLTNYWEVPQTVLPNPLVGVNYRGVGSTRITDNQYFVKADHNISSKDKIMFRYATNSPEYLQVPAASPQFTYKVLGRNNNIASQWIHIFSPAIVNEFRYGYTTSRDDSFNPRANTDFDLSAIGLDAFRVLTDGNRKLTPRETGVPSINAGSFQGLAERDGGNGFDDNRLHQYSDAVSINFASHTIKVGGEFRRVSLFRGAANVPRGSFVFGDASANNGYAAFLLGIPTATNTPEGLPLTDVRQNRMGFYFNDDWKATKKLTLNLGLRYEYNSAASDIQGLWRSLEFPNGLSAPPVYVPTKIRTQYQFYKPQKDMWMPRIGIAYRFDDKWVARAGFGIFYNVHQLNNYTILNLNPPLSGSANFNNGFSANGVLTNPSAPIFTLSQPFGVFNPLTTAVSANALNTDNFQPQVVQWSFDLQRRIFYGMVLSVGYVGSKTSHLDNTVERDTVAPAFNTNSTIQQRRPFPTVNDDGVIRQLTRLRFFDSGGNSWYQGLHLNLQRRYNNGFSFAIAHTFSKTLMEGYGRNEGDGFNSNTYQDPYNRAAEKGRVGFDVTHNFVANFVYEIPTGDMFKKGIANAVLGGWQVNGIVTLRTGFPFAVTQGSITNNGSGAPVRPDRVAQGSLSNATVNQWFDPDAFHLVSCVNAALPETCHYGNSGMGILEGPGFKNIDSSLFKNFRITERVKLQFRTEFFNLFNTPQFARPNTGLQTNTNQLPQGTPGNVTYPSQRNIVRGPGAITGLVAPMRNIQFGLKLLW